MTKSYPRSFIHNRVVPEVLPDVVTERVYQIRISGEVFGEDNQTVFRMLKECLINSPVWDWVEGFNVIANMCEAFWSWSDHYNGQGGFGKSTPLALATLKTLHFKKEYSMVFERYS